MVRLLILSSILIQGYFGIFAGELTGDPLAGSAVRSLGPAGMSGRVTVVAAVADNPNIVYVGAASGGVWK